MQATAFHRLFVLTVSAAILFAAAGPAFADKWSFPPEVQKQTFEFGKSKLVIEIDGTRDRGFPPHTLSIHLNGELMAKYRNVGFSKVYASEDNRYFVGLSNDGIPGTAFIIFDAQGNLIREQKHRFLPHAMYTGWSVTRVREWFNEAHPAVEFKADTLGLGAVFVQGSNGQRYDLLRPDLGWKPAADRPGN